MFLSTALSLFTQCLSKFVRFTTRIGQVVRIFNRKVLTYPNHRLNSAGRAFSRISDV